MLSAYLDDQIDCCCCYWAKEGRPTSSCHSPSLLYLLLLLLASGRRGRVNRVEFFWFVVELWRVSRDPHACGGVCDAMLAGNVRRSYAQYAHAFHVSHFSHAFRVEPPLASGFSSSFLSRAMGAVKDQNPNLASWPMLACPDLQNDWPLDAFHTTDLTDCRLHAALVFLCVRRLLCPVENDPLACKPRTDT